MSQPSLVQSDIELFQLVLVAPEGVPKNHLPAGPIGRTGPDGCQIDAFDFDRGACEMAPFARLLRAVFAGSLITAMMR